jgi:hypothetical protein
MASPAIGHEIGLPGTYAEPKPAALIGAFVQAIDPDGIIDV